MSRQFITINGNVKAFAVVDRDEIAIGQAGNRLDFLIGEIKNQGLDFGLRVGFPHHFDPASGIGIWPLCRRVFTDVNTRKEWVRYIGRVAEIVERHRSAFRFAFFSWEDFFCPYSVMPGLSPEERLEIARQSGYQSWLTSTQTLELVNFLYSDTFESMEEVPVPKRDSAAFWLFIRFIDRFLIDELVVPARTILPELSMEVRVDKDGVRMNDGYTWVDHDLMLDDDPIRGSYWGPYHGAQNNGETLDAKDALSNLEYMLKRVSDNGRNRRHVLEQFNFIDNTPEFAGHHAVIDPSQLSIFLRKSAPLLRKYASGYGLWAYRDYADSALYNASFEVLDRGWRLDGEVEIIQNADGDNAIHMQPGSLASQTFIPSRRFVALGASEQLRFCAHFEPASPTASMAILFNGTEAGAIREVGEGRHCAELDIQLVRSGEVTFSIRSDSDVVIDDLQLYAFVQRLHVYDENGEPGPLRNPIIKLNSEWLSN